MTSSKEVTMHIRELALTTSNLAAQRAFYTDLFGLHPIAESPGMLSFQIGATHLSFRQDDACNDTYHYAFNIPENQIAAAAAWVSQRTPLITAAGQTIFSFENWNAHAIYFRDTCGNILEFIARHTLLNATDEPFDTAWLLCVSEIGVPVNNVSEAVRALTTTFGLSVYDDNADQTFAAVGDESGLFIVVQRGRVWFPETGVAAHSTPDRATIGAGSIPLGRTDTSGARVNSAPELEGFLIQLAQSVSD
jgi:catechol-2,3-dioxygenase